MPINKLRFIDVLTALGLIVGLVYSFTWVKVLGQFLMGGSTFALLSIASTYLGLETFWQHRQEFRESPKISKLQQRIGYGFILFGTAFFGVGFGRAWSQAVGWIIVLGGLVLSRWELARFRPYWRPVLLILLSIYPGTYRVFEYLWNAIMPTNLLEVMTAWTGSRILQMMGQRAWSEGSLVHLLNNGVTVTEGCNGLYMILTILWIGLLLSNGLRQDRLLPFFLLGVGLAFVNNAVRVAWLTLIAVNGSNESFEFWHGSWGAQIFVVPIFWVYYLIALRLGSGRSPEDSNSSKKKRAIST